MANPFDQFDPAPAAAAGNVFDQFNRMPTDEQGYTRGRTIGESTALRPAVQPRPMAADVPPPQEGPGAFESLLRGIGDQPIVGPLLSRAEAAKNALLASRHPEEADISHAEDFSQRYAENLQREQERTAQAYQAHPWLAYGGNLGAGFLGGGALLKGGGLGARLLGYVPGASLPRAALTGATSGAGINAIDAALRGQDPETAAAVGGAVGGALPVVGRAISGPLAHFAPRPTLAPAAQSAAENVAAHIATPPPFPAPGGPHVYPVSPAVVPSGVQLVDETGRATPDFLSHAIDLQYDNLNRAATSIMPNAVVGGMRSIKNDLMRQNFRPEYQPEVFNLLNGFEADAANGNAVSFNDVRAAIKHLNTMTGPLQTTNQAAASFTKQGLNDFLTGLNQQKDIMGGNISANMDALSRVNGDYFRHKNVDALQEAVTKATAGGTINPANNLRVQARALLRQQAVGKLRLDPETVRILTDINSGSQGIMRSISTLGMRHGLTGLTAATSLMFGGIGHVIPIIVQHGGAEMARNYETAAVTKLFDAAIENELSKAPSVAMYNQHRPQLPPGRISSLANVPAAGALVPALNMLQGAQ